MWISMTRVPNRRWCFDSRKQRRQDMVKISYDPERAKWLAWLIHILVDIFY